MMVELRNRFLTYQKSLTAGNAESFFKEMDAVITHDLDSGASIKAVNEHLSTIAGWNKDAGDATYELIPMPGKMATFYGIFVISQLGASTIRIYDKRDNHYEVMFSFSPQLENNEFETPLLLCYSINLGDKVAFAVMLGGGVSGFLPPRSLLAWTYDPSVKAASRSLTLLHKNDLLLMSPLESKETMIARWCKYDEGSHAITKIEEIWYDSANNFQVLRAYSVIPENMEQMPLGR